MTADFSSLATSHDPWLVVLSFLIAALASYTTLDLARRVRTPDLAMAVGWWLAGSLTMGTGIWAMHFVGMLAFRLPIAVGYDVFVTLLSWLAAVGVSALALGLAAGERLGRVRLVAGSLVMGAGICAMHYTGMLALSLQPGIRWSPWLVAASAVIAVAASAAALVIFFRMRGLSGWAAVRWQLGAALFMAAGITGMHYTGMAAADFPASSVCLSVGGLRGGGLYALIAGSTIALLALTLVSSALDARRTAQRLALEREVDARTADLRQARDAAEAASRAKTEFLAAISHELRTPLTSIRGFAELMEGRSQEASTRRQAALIRKGAEHLHALLSEILDFAKLESGAMRLSNEALDLSPLLQGTVDFFSLAAREKGLLLALDVEPGRQLHIQGDSLRIKQILNNLLSNAIKFTSTGGVVVRVQRAPEWLHIHVDDTGPGIAEELQELVFEKFRQANDRISHEHGGTGLGLALSRGLAQLMKGELTLRSELGRGSCFTLSLPVSAPPTAPAAPG